jgi:ArsR family transcriptional regulator
MRKNAEISAHLTNRKKFCMMKGMKQTTIFTGGGVFMPEIQQENLLDPDNPALHDMAELFKVFGDTTRVRIIFTLFQKEACVQEIANVLQMTQSAISHQLRILKQARLVRSRREGKSIYYSLADAHIHTIFRQALDHIAE